MTPAADEPTDADLHSLDAAVEDHEDHEDDVDVVAAPSIETTTARIARHKAETARGLRQAPASSVKTSASGTSPWVGKSRDELNDWARTNSARMSSTKVGASVTSRMTEE